MNTLTLNANQNAIISSSKRFMLIVLLALAVIVLFSSFGFAVTDTALEIDSQHAIEQGVKHGTAQIYKVITAIVLPIVAVIFAWSALKALFGGDKGMEIAKKTILTSVIVIAIVYLAPVIVTQVGTWFDGVGDAGIFQ